MKSTESKPIVKRYSTAFQLKVVREIESGKLTASKARRVYDIGGKTTIAIWLRRHGRAHLLSEVVEVRIKDEPQKIKQLTERVRQLETALADVQLEKYAMLGILQVAAEGGDVDLKKSIEQRPSTERELLRRLSGLPR
jgi:transposase-like protein